MRKFIMGWLRFELSEVCVEGTFQNIFSDNVVPDTARFGDAL